MSFLKLCERERARESRNEMKWTIIYLNMWKWGGRSELIKRAKQNVFVKHSVTLLSRYKQSHPTTTERDKHRHTKRRERERERESFFFLVLAGQQMWKNPDLFFDKEKKKPDHKNRAHIILSQKIYIILFPNLEY